ncbi:MAG: DegT/DnrJ/EryC1/StrS family aminotransferase [Planctomycetales bacterium]|nr:DegT/DnrJ/EryC1/StrS family aminotransferase [Planctomycetales bacterium]
MPSTDSALAINGSEPTCDFDWPRWPVHDSAEETAILEVLRSGKWWFGERVKAFENEFANFQGAKFAVSCTNGTTAIEMALRATGVVEGDEVIVPCYSFIATASAVVTMGAIPVFADILPDTLCIDPADVAKEITSRTAAIIPVHVAGRVADMDAINSLAKQHNLKVFEDAAHAWGSRTNGQGAGTLSQAGTFSFQETKNMTAGEGGILVTDDENLADLCRSFTHCGRTKGSAWYDHDVLGSNLRLTEFQAAILSAQLKRLPEQIATRERNAARIDAALTEVASVQTLAAAPEMTRRSYHIYIFRMAPEFADKRDTILEALNAEGIPASAGWYRPLYRNRVFQDAHVGPAHGIKSPLANKNVDYRSVECPVCESVCNDAIWIPQYVLLGSDEQLEKLCLGLQKVLKQVANL